MFYINKVIPYNTGKKNTRSLIKSNIFGTPSGSANIDRS